MQKARHIVIIKSADGPTAVFTTGAAKRDYRAIAVVSAAIAATVTALILCVKNWRKK